MPRYHIDTDTLIACCLACEPEAAFSFHDLKQIISLTTNTQNRYLFCDTTPAAVQKVVDAERTAKSLNKKYGDKGYTFEAVCAE